MRNHIFLQAEEYFTIKYFFKIKSFNKKISFFFFFFFLLNTCLVLLQSLKRKKNRISLFRHTRRPFQSATRWQHRRYHSNLSTSSTFRISVLCWLQRYSLALPSPFALSVIAAQCPNTRGN